MSTASTEPTGEGPANVLVQFYVPAALQEQIGRTRRAHHITTGQLILAAISATRDDIDAELARERAAAVTPADNPLFAIDPIFGADPVGPTRPAGKSPSKQMGARLTATAQARIDELVAQSTARSRSAYIITALTLFFRSLDPQESP